MFAVVELLVVELLVVVGMLAQHTRETNFWGGCAITQHVVKLSFVVVAVVNVLEHGLTSCIVKCAGNDSLVVAKFTTSGNE